VHIRRVVVQNVKSFREETTFELGRGVNYLVGDNNGGKSTVLQALLFLFEGPSKWSPEAFYSTDATGATRVMAEITGGVEDLVVQDKFSDLRPFVFEDDGEQILRLERRSDERTITQKNKTKNLNVKTITFWQPETGQFENPLGIDATAKAIFDFEAIWADAQPGDHIDFANTKTLGRLLDSAFQRFAATERWELLVTAHKNAFAPDDDASFLVETGRLASEIKALVEEQYGQAAMRFEFNLPDPSVFMKQGRLHVDDGAGETPVEGKGSGMQRAIALGIIQLYAKAGASERHENPTPLILMLDEPETWLHPTAQLRLGDALSVIGESEQVFIITHSPYLIRTFDNTSHHLAVIAGKGTERRIDTSTTLGLFGVGAPTWGEINYRAFDICSHEFHNELYGHVTRHVEAALPVGTSGSTKDVDDFLVAHGVAASKTWKRNDGRQHPATLATYIRNTIHHPENQLNAAVTSEELRISTDSIVAVVEALPA